MLSKKYIEELTYKIIGAAIEVHKNMGAGLLENVYQLCMEEELRLRKLNFETEKIISVSYKGKPLAIDFRCDLFIEKCIVVELKAINYLAEIHDAQLMNYMKLLKVPKGILINFNCSNIFHEGQKTFVNEYFASLPDE